MLMEKPPSAIAHLRTTKLQAKYQAKRVTVVQYAQMDLPLLRIPLLMIILHIILVVRYMSMVA